jgi:dephospho-CoA kinase
MIKLGLTGGIGSGKSTIAKLFCLLGVPVYNSDIEAKKLYKTDKLLKEEIIKKFGEQAYLTTDEINKQFLIDKVFVNHEKLNELNQLVHPRVKAHFEKWLKKHESSDLIVKEAAILFESGAYKQVDKIIVVNSTQEQRIKRVMERDKVSRAQVIKRMNKQWQPQELIKKADFVVDNSGKISVINQVLQIYNSLLYCSQFNV